MSNQFSNFLRDFAAANSESFEPDQIQYLIYCAEEIESLIKDRDEARQDICFNEAAERSFGPNGVPYHPSVAHKIAKEYGWDCFKAMCTEHPQCSAQADNQGLSDIEKEP